MNKKDLIDAALDDSKLLNVFIPGESPMIRDVRFQIASFAKNTSANNALLLGPVGSGKSTIARVMALMRYLHFCTDDKRKQIIENLKFDGPFRIDKKLLDFYEEMNLTGLIPNLAQAQLFGVAKGAATGVSGKAGIFEQAGTGHSKPSAASNITGGVVFLDEIGDLHPDIQPMLLSLLTGAEVFRVGGEGNPAFGYDFKGCVIAATWREPDGIIRKDLFSRLTDYVIRMPGLNERQDEIEEIVTFIEEDIQNQHRDFLERLKREDPLVVCRAKLAAESKKELKVKPGNISLLKKQDWSKRGDLRGLRQVLERCFYDGVTVSEALGHHAVLTSTKTVSPSRELSKRIVEQICDGTTPVNLSEEIRKMEGEIRKTIVDLLRSDNDLLNRLAVKADLSIPMMKRKLTDLLRDRAGRKQ